jgi:glycosyltransferase involved in cell wall biosynthesis
MPSRFILENWLASRAAARVVAVSHSVADALMRHGTPRRKLMVIPNGLVTERIDIPVTLNASEKWKARIGWDPARRTIGVVARPKDQQVLLRALDMVRTPVRLVLAGVDPASRLGTLAADAPERHAVVCLPYTPDVRPLYDLLELVLLPSQSEGLSQGLLEAMALAKPVIASSVSGNRDVITHRVDGLLVPLDPQAWARSIEEVLGDANLAMQLGAAARKTSRERFSLEHTVRHTADLYRAVVQFRHQRGRTTRLP